MNRELHKTQLYNDAVAGSCQLMLISEIIMSQALSYVQVQLMASYSISQGMRQMAFVKLSLEVEEGAVIIN